MVGFGVGVICWALAAAGRRDLEAADRVIATGPYAWSRNPMYLGWALVHVGTGLASGSGWVLWSYVPAAAVIHREILAEERGLATRFGDRYSRYARRVARYLPVGSRSAGNRAP